MIPRNATVSEYTVQERGRLLLRDVSATELRFLRKLEDQSKIILKVGSQKDDIVLLTRMHCGVVQAGSKRIFIEPKVPTRNLLFLVESTYSMPDVQFFDEAYYAKGRNFFEFLMHFLYAKLDRLVAGGLYRSYIGITENAPAVRGSVNIPRTLTENFVNRHKIVSEYDDYTEDVLENRVIRYALESTKNLATTSALRARLERLVSAFEGVSNPWHLPSDVFQRMVYHRLNEHYRPIHELCRVLLSGTALEIPSGPVAFRSFLVNMEYLFQEFLYATIRRSPYFAGCRVERQSGSKILLRQGTGVTGDIHTKPDVRVASPENILVVDAKYKEPLTAWMGRRVPTSTDVYQMIAYCVTNRCPGALVYPKTNVTETDMNEIYEIRGNPTVFKLRTVDLSGSVSGLKSVCNYLCEDLSQMALADPHLRAGLWNGKRVSAPTPPPPALLGVRRAGLATTD